MGGMSMNYSVQEANSNAADMAISILHWSLTCSWVGITLLMSRMAYTLGAGSEVQCLLADANLCV